MIRKIKHIGAGFMWIAMLVIIVHAAVPHHHHADVATCEHECTHDNTLSTVQQSATTNLTITTTQCQESHDQTHCHACHFSSEATIILSKLTVDNVSCIYSLIDAVLQPKERIAYIDIWLNLYAFDFQTHTSLRGPPVFV